MRPRRLTPLLFIAAAIAWPGEAPAAIIGLDVKIYEDGNASASSILTTASGGTIVLNGTYANVADFNFNGFTVSSNAGVATTQGVLQGTGGIIALASGHTLTILESDNGFTSPAGPSYTLGSSSSYTEAPYQSGDSFSFKSYATAGQVLFGIAVPSPGFTYASLSGPGSKNEASSGFTAASGYTLTQRYDWQASASGVIFQPTGSTVATGFTSVPEPASLAMVLLGVGSVGLAATRRRRAA